MQRMFGDIGRMASLRKVALACAVLVLAITSLSAFLRLSASGLGCEPWPQCYGQSLRDRQQGVVTPPTGVVTAARISHRIAAVAALLGTIFGLGITALLAAWATDAANLAGVGSHDAATLANASAYMEAFGHVVIAWMWLRQALVAARKDYDAAADSDRPGPPPIPRPPPASCAARSRCWARRTKKARARLPTEEHPGFL